MMGSRGIRVETQRRGFTLVELLVVIAIVLILSVVVISTMGLLTRRSLKTARNSFAGYFEGIRSQAVNSNSAIVVAVLPGKRGEPVHYPLTVKQGDSSTTINVGPGIVAFMVNRRAFGGANSSKVPVWERLLYLDRDFIFEKELTEEIEIVPATVRRWQQSKWPVFEHVSAQDLKQVGIPDGALVMLIRADGKTVIPGDVPGYVVDRADPKQLDGDIVLGDGTSLLFLDISPVARVRGALLLKEQLPQNSPFLE